MPVAGFKKGQRVLTPALHTGKVSKVTKRSGREFVTVRYDHGGEREFSASSLRPL